LRPEAESGSRTPHTTTGAAHRYATKGTNRPAAVKKVRAVGTKERCPRAGAHQEHLQHTMCPTRTPRVAVISGRLRTVGFKGSSKSRHSPHSWPPRRRARAMEHGMRQGRRIREGPGFGRRPASSLTRRPEVGTISDVTPQTHNGAVREASPGLGRQTMALIQC